MTKLHRQQQKHEREHTASQKRVFTKSCQHGSRTRADQQRHEDKKHEQANSVTRVFNTGSQGDTKNKTWEASTLTGVLREQQEEIKTICQSHQCVVISTRITKMWHMLHEFEPHVHTTRLSGTQRGERLRILLRPSVMDMARPPSNIVEKYVLLSAQRFVTN